MVGCGVLFVVFALFWYQVRYACAEQYMMAEKAKIFGDEQVRRKIMVTANPKRQRTLGREVRGFDQEAWVEQRRAIVDRATYAKFTQNADMKKQLLDTGEKVYTGFIGPTPERVCRVNRQTFKFIRKLCTGTQN